jgi:hypothetical protein
MIPSEWSEERDERAGMANQISTPTVASEGGRAAPGPLTDEAKAALVERWRGILAGTIQPEVISFPPEVDRIVEEEIRKSRYRISPTVRAEMRLEQYLGEAYSAEVVLWMDSPAGLALIAVDDAEVSLFCRNFPDECCVRVHPHYPPRG